MLRTNLSEQEIDELVNLRLKRNSNVGERAWFVLLNTEGKSCYQIAKQTGRNVLTVRNWIKKYQKKGVDGLYNRPPPGRPANKSNAIKPRINELLEKVPMDYGYQEANWTVALLVDYFEKQSIFVSTKTIQRVLKAEGWCYKRLSKVPTKDGPTEEEKQTRINDIISSIKNDKAQGEEVTVLFEDESHFSIQPYVQRAWCRIGEKTAVEAPKKKESCSIFGALNIETQKCYWRTVKKGNSKAFIAFLRQLRKAFPSGIIVLIVDNSSTHKSKKVREFLKKNPWIKIYYITAYSPELNPIERFWGWLKSKVYGKKTFFNLTDLIAKIRKIFWHYNEKRLTIMIDFSFEMYVDLL